ncbi:MAG: hypothetical protein OXN83_05820 [Oligoflexia bacterium]|nr:hypothetical protein [Oligoflexia bacterium]
MKQQLLSLSLIFLFLTSVSKAEARKKRVFPRKWALSIVNAYSFYEPKKSSIDLPGKWNDFDDGQMKSFFSALELSRNFGQFEVGAKIQNVRSAFISPFFKWNLNKNNSRASIIPAFTAGVVPSLLTGVWLRLSLGLSINRYMSLEPFIGAYAWHKLKENPEYEQYNFHFNSGLKINLYY